MNRIYLKKRLNGDYLIRDKLDDKKLGIIKIRKNNTIYKIKNKYQHRNIGVEAQLCFRSAKAWNIYYCDYIFYYNEEMAETANSELPIYYESCRLKASDEDMFGRPTQLHPAAHKAWKKMKHAANKDKIKLQIISAYRSLDYQKQLINNKLAKGLDIEDILKVNTLPGYSEHHTGCAIDIGCKGDAILEQNFDQTIAFTWLQTNANKFDFYMSYPKGNSSGICYEPWHWCYKPK